MPNTIVADSTGVNPLAPDYDLFYSPESVGQECLHCRKVLRWREFEKDTSMKTGHKLSCMLCLSAPCLTMEEHSIRLRESSLNSHGVRRQRHADQEEFRKFDEREGRRMHTSDFLLKLHKLIPSLFVKEGVVGNDLALYEVADQPQAKWGGKNFSYLGFIEFGSLKEYSTYEFNEKRDVMVREKERGWRTTLLRCIKAGLLTEDQCNREFGFPSGRASTVWYKQLHAYRNLRSETPVQKMDETPALAG
jgi:hypothetical protein